MGMQERNEAKGKCIKENDYKFSETEIRNFHGTIFHPNVIPYLANVLNVMLT